MGILLDETPLQKVALFFMQVTNFPLFRPGAGPSGRHAWKIRSTWDMISKLPCRPFSSKPTRGVPNRKGTLPTNPNFDQVAAEL
jgi:hypothetical protein